MNKDQEISQKDNWRKFKNYEKICLCVRITINRTKLETCLVNIVFYFKTNLTRGDGVEVRVEFTPITAGLVS